MFLQTLDVVKKVPGKNSKIISLSGENFTVTTVVGTSKREEVNN